MAMRTLIFEITWKGPHVATLQFVRDNLVDVIHLPKAGNNGRITLSWPATDELAHPSMRPRLHADVAGLVAAIAADRAGFEAAFASRVDADGMWQLVRAMSAPEDRAIYDEPAFAAAYRAALEEGFAQGPAGYVRDLVLASSPWPVAPEAIDVRADLWYGARDTSPVHSPDHGATLARRFPRARLHQLAGEGAALLWTRADDILAALLSRG